MAWADGISFLFVTESFVNGNRKFVYDAIVCRPSLHVNFCHSWSTLFRVTMSFLEILCMTCIFHLITYILFQHCVSPWWFPECDTTLKAEAKLADLRHKTILQTIAVSCICVDSNCRTDYLHCFGNNNLDDRH